MCGETKEAGQRVISREKNATHSSIVYPSVAAVLERHGTCTVMLKSRFCWYLIRLNSWRVLERFDNWPLWLSWAHRTREQLAELTASRGSQLSYVFSPHTLGKLLNNNIINKIICMFLHFVPSHMKKPLV
jgi:hypothetical protein